MMSACRIGVGRCQVEEDGHGKGGDNDVLCPASTMFTVFVVLLLNICGSLALASAGPTGAYSRLIIFSSVPIRCISSFYGQEAEQGQR